MSKKKSSLFTGLKNLGKDIKKEAKKTDTFRTFKIGYEMKTKPLSKKQIKKKIKKRKKKRSIKDLI